MKTTAAPGDQSPDVSESAELVADARARLPYPDDVLDCVAERASGDGRLRTALRNPDEAASGRVVGSAAASCVIEVRTAPRFAEDLQRAAGGALSDQQISCATREFSRLTPGQVEAAAGAVLNPEKAEAVATAPVKKIYETCHIKVESR